jgi:hypothetical protein
MTPNKNLMQPTPVVFSFPFKVLGVLCILCISTAPQRAAHGTMPAQVAIHPVTNKVGGEEQDLNPRLLLYTRENMS